MTSTKIYELPVDITEWKFDGKTDMHFTWEYEDGSAELLDLYPTVSRLCGLEVPARLQGKNLVPAFDDPAHAVRDAAFTVNGADGGFLLREEKWAYIQYGESAAKGVELFDMVNDPRQYTNLASRPEHQAVVQGFRAKLAAKLKAVRANDLGRK